MATTFTRTAPQCNVECILHILLKKKHDDTLLCVVRKILLYLQFLQRPLHTVYQEDSAIIRNKVSWVDLDQKIQIHLHMKFKLYGEKDARKM
jgi:hypothetical protein